jgi:uncharacterized protein (TIGR02246 family)
MAVHMSPDEQEIRRLVETWARATREGDIQTVLTLMADDVVFLVCGQPPMTGRAAFEAAARAQSRGNPDARPRVEGSSEIQELTILGDWAYMWTRLRVEITPTQGPSVTRAGHTLSILRKESGKWLLARDANLLGPG